MSNEVDKLTCELIVAREATHEEHAKIVRMAKKLKYYKMDLEDARMMCPAKDLETANTLLANLVDQMQEIIDIVEKEGGCTI